MRKRRILYLPLETKARELVGKTFLAARAVERGWIVVCGAQGEIKPHMRRSPPGAYIEISLPNRKADRLTGLRAQGHRLANLCEEGVVYPDGLDYCQRKVGLQAMELVELSLVPGERNAEHIRHHRPGHAHALVVTGNPRFDTLSPQLRCVYEADSAVLRRRFGRYLLVNTNFGRCNRLETDAERALPASAKTVEGTDAAFNERYRNYKQRQMTGLQALLREVSQAGIFDSIIVRPHPSENHETWREWARGSRIHVCYEGAANEWMLAAEAVMHPGCTTGIEGLLLDRPVFSYLPEPGTEFLNPADAASEPVASAPEFLDKFAQMRGLEGEAFRQRYAKQRAAVSHFIAAMDPPFAADRILDALDRLDVSTFSDAEAGLSIQAALRRMPRRVRAWFASHGSEPAARQLQKFPPPTAAEVRTPLDLWARRGVLKSVPQITWLGARLWVLH